MAVDPFKPVQYIDGTGQNWQIKQHASQVVISGGNVVVKGTYQPWPYPSKDLRHVTGVDSTGTIRRKCIVPDPSKTIWSASGVVTWTDEEGNTITREGRFGDKLPGTF